MSMTETTGLDRDAEGFLTDAAQWNEDVAATIAREAGIELTPPPLAGREVHADDLPGDR